MKTFAVSIIAAGALSAFGAEFQVGPHAFTLPDGFTIELVAQSPLVDRPIEADFDEQGRLYVTDSSGTNDKVDKQQAEKPHRVMRLEDSDGDGRFDRSVVFANKFFFPEGAMWLDGSLYVSAPPSIWKLTDTDGDGVADKREEWFKGGTVTGCANDLHGPYLGLDGFIYWNKGAFAKQTHERPGLPPIVTRAAHTFRMRPDGTGLEIVMTGGMDNPVGLAFTAEGDRFFTSTFVQNPEAGRRDGLVHEIYGGVYGKVNDVVDDHPQTGDLMPITTHLGAAAPCGIIRYESSSLGDAYRDNLFVCQFNMHKVSRHILVRDGSTYKTENSDFLTAADTDFHPTDVLEDADGSLLVIDTGGWYKLCCPTSQLAKPDVLGAIYRIRKTGAKHVEDAWGRKADWSKPVELLKDERPAVRRRAMQLAAKAQSIPDLGKIVKESKDSGLKMRALWTLARINSDEANKTITPGLRDPDARVRLTAENVVSVRANEFAKNTEAKSALADLLQGGSPAEKRVAAEAFGRMKEVFAVKGILNAAEGQIDRALEHALIYALIEIGKPDDIRGGLAVADEETRKVALITLSQIPNGLSAQDVEPSFLREGALRSTAQWIVERRPEWGKDMALWLTTNSLPPDVKVRILTKLAGSVEIQKLVAFSSSTTEFAGDALRIMAGSGLKKTPEIWLKSLSQLVDSSFGIEAISAVRALNAAKDSSEIRAALMRVTDNEKNPPGLRIAAQRALPEGSRVSEGTFKVMMDVIEPQHPADLRADAVAALQRGALSEERRLQLAEAFARVGPMELTRLIEIFEKNPSEATGLRLVEALKKSPVLASLPPYWANQRLAKFPESVRKAAEALPQPSQSDAPSQRAHLEELLAVVKTGDIRRGQAIFNNVKVACVSCHSMGYNGGKVGPDLTSIGQVRTEMDLLESILYPSASFVRSYEPVLVQTRDGETHTGILRGDTEQGILLVSGPNAEERIARGDIADMRPGAVSVMPAGLESQLSKQELGDLVAFLKATKWGAN